jgi:hypothetical protein
LKCVYRSTSYPPVIGSMATMYGYLKSFLGRRSLALPDDVVQYLRAEQRSKLRKLLWGPPMGLGRPGTHGRNCAGSASK